MVQVMAVVIVVIFAVTHTNQVVAVVLNHVMTVVVLTTVVHVLSVLALAVTAAAVMKIVVTVIQHRVKQMATQQVMLAVQKDPLATVHVTLVIVLTQVVTVTVATVHKATVQVQARLTAVLVTALHLAKNLTHVTAQVHHVAIAIVVTVIVAVIAQMPTAVTTVY